MTTGGYWVIPTGAHLLGDGKESGCSQLRITGQVRILRHKQRNMNSGAFCNQLLLPVWGCPMGMELGNSFNPFSVLVP